MTRHFQFWLWTSILVAGALPAQELAPVSRPASGTVEDVVYDELMAAHDQVEALTGSNADTAARAAAFGHLGELYAAYDLWDAARSSFANALALDGDAFRWAYLLAYANAQRADLEAAVSGFQQALAIDGDRLSDQDRLPARLRLGEAQLDLDRAGDAHETFEQAVAIEASAAAHFGLARALDRSGRSAEAVKHYESALALQPGASQVHYPLALALRRAGRTDEARQHLEERGETPVAFADPLLDEVRRQAGGGAFHKFRGDQAVLAGNLQEAVEAYRKAVQVDPKSFYYRKSLGLTLHQTGDAAGAREQLVAAIDLEPGQAQAKKEKADLHFTIGSMAANQGVLYAAVEHYGAALAHDPKHVDTLLMLGNIRGRQGRMEDALTYFDLALAAAPDRADIRFQKATTLMDLGRFGEAVPELRKKLELTPGDAQAGRLLEIATERAAKAKSSEEEP